MAAGPPRRRHCSARRPASARPARAVAEAAGAGAKRSLDTYVAATRYPPESRPIREHPDQMELAAPERTRPLSQGAEEHLRRAAPAQAGQGVRRGRRGGALLPWAARTRAEPLPCEVTPPWRTRPSTWRAGAASPGAAGLRGHGTRVATRWPGTGRSPRASSRRSRASPMFSGTLRVDVRACARAARRARPSSTSSTRPRRRPRSPARCARRWSRARCSSYLGLQVRKAGRYVVAGRAGRRRRRARSRRCPSTRSCRRGCRR